FPGSLLVVCALRVEYLGTPRDCTNPWMARERARDEGFESLPINRNRARIKILYGMEDIDIVIKVLLELLGQLVRATLEFHLNSILFPRVCVNKKYDNQREGQEQR